MLQLKEMAHRVQELDSTISSADFCADLSSNDLTHSLDGNFSNKTNTRSTETVSNNNIEANEILSKGSKAQSGKSEWVVQDEPGVYLTLSAVPGGGNELKHVRFRYIYIHTHIHIYVAISSFVEIWGIGLNVVD